jgi:hypothetical protein
VNEEKTLKAVAQDMFTLLTKFKGDAEASATKFFKILKKVFEEQREVVDAAEEADEIVKVKDPKSAPGDGVQNPSDPDATYGGHKGQGCHARTVETCAATVEEGPTLKVISDFKLEPARMRDGQTLTPAIESLDGLGSSRRRRWPTRPTYGSDSNVEAAKERGATVISPAGGKDPELDEVRLADFSETEDEEIAARQEGPQAMAFRKDQKGDNVYAFDGIKCSLCSKAEQCSVKFNDKIAILKFSQKDMRISKRRAFEQTESFKKQYVMRSRIEASNSRLDRRTGFKKLRYRGLTKVNLAVVAKIIGMNCMSLKAYCALIIS